MLKNLLQIFGVVEARIGNGEHVWSILDLNKKVKMQVYIVSNLGYISFY